MRRSRGFTIVEMICAMGLGLAVLSAGYSMYRTVIRIDDREAAREAMVLTMENAMSRIKSDVRASSSVSGSTGILTISGHGRRTVYNSVSGSGLIRESGRGRVVYRNLNAQFIYKDSGVNVRLWSESKVHRRPLRVETASFVRPRN